MESLRFDAAAVVHADTLVRFVRRKPGTADAATAGESNHQEKTEQEKNRGMT